MHNLSPFNDHDNQSVGGIFFAIRVLNVLEREGGAVAKWSKVLLLREKINKNLAIPGLSLGLSNL